MAEQTLQTNFDNIQSWLQQLVQESQTTRAAAQEMLTKLNAQPQQNGQIMAADGNAEKKVDELRNYIDGRFSKLESDHNEVKNALNEIKDKVNKITS